MADDIRESVELRLRTDGFDKGAADAKAFAAGEKQAADAAELLARAQTIVEKSTTRVASRLAAYTFALDPAEKALKKVEQGENLVAAARAKGIPVTDSMLRAVDLARDRYARLQTDTQGATGALALNRQEALALTYTFNDVVASLASGASPMTIIAQQGGQVTQAFGGLRATADKLLPILARFAPLLAGAGVALLTFEEAVSTFEEIRALNEGAATAGVSTDLFQIWAAHAAKLRLEAKDAEAAILQAGKTLAGQIDNFSALSIDGGESRIAQRANNLSQVVGRDVASKGLAADARALDDMHRAALQLVADYFAAAVELERAGRVLDANEARAQAVNAATEVWGDAGRKVADALRDGTVTVDEFSRKSKEAGVTWSRDILDAQKQVSQELALAHDRLSKALNPAAEELERISLRILGAWARIVNAIADGLTGMRHAAEEVSPMLHERHSGVESAKSVFDRLRGGAAATAPKPGSLAHYERRLKLDQDEEDLAMRNGRVGRIIQPYGPPMPEYEDVRVDTPLPPSRPEGVGRAAPRERKPRAPRHPHATREQTDAVERYIESLERAVGVLEAESAALGGTNAEREKAVDLERAEAAAKERKKPLTEAEIAQVKRLAEQHAALRQQIEQRHAQERAANDQTRFFGETAYQAIDRLTTSSFRLNDALQMVVRSLAQAALRASLLGEGPLAGVLGTAGTGGAPGGLLGLLSGGLGKLFSGENILGGLGKLFSGGFAAGGAIPAGRFGLVGERGPELIFAGPAPIAVAPIAARGGATTVNNSIAVSIQTPNPQAFRQSESQIAASLARAVARGQRNL